MLFSKPASSFDLGNGPDLADQIAGLGTSLTDRLATRYTFQLTPSGSQVSGWIDFSNAISFAFSCAAHTALNASPGPVATALVQLQWGDGAGTVYAQEVFEVNVGGNGVSVSTFLLDRALGPKLNITLIAWNYSDTTLDCKVSTSSRPIDRPVLHEIGGNGGSQTAGYDGVLGVFQGSLAAGASSSFLRFALAIGTAEIKYSAGSSGTNTMQFAFTLGGGGAGYTFRVAPALNDNLVQLPLVNRPLSCVVTNEGSTAGFYFLQAWTQGD